LICHTQKIIFIHIPKCGGSSIKNFYFNGQLLNWQTPNYEVLYGYCPKRKIHLQHATAKQLLDTDLITTSTWNSYFKFTFIRNPWDRAYSDYYWIMKDTKIEGTFEDFITKSGPFKEVLNNSETKAYRGDHLIPQTDFFDFDGEYVLDFVGRFEQYKEDILKLNQILHISKEFNEHEKRNLNRLEHYSLFYSASWKEKVEEIYKTDIEKMGYFFEDLKSADPSIYTERD
jgi:chondroitin 4-sulfotransferase 11